MERLWTIMRKEFYHIIRDYRTLAIIVILPTFLLILLGYGVSGESKDTALAVVDLSKSDASRRYIDYFTAGDQFKVTYDVLNETEILDLIDRELVSAGIYIPEDFGRKLDTGQSTDVQFYVNGSDPADAQSTNLKLETIAQVATQQILTEQLKKNVNAAGLSDIKLPITSHTKTLYNPDGKEKVYMIPGLTAMVLQVIALLLTALSIVREREQGTMEQLVVTPIRSWELVLGKLLPYLFVGIFNTVATLLVAVYMFGIVIEGNFLLLIGLSTIFILGSLGMGVLISNISRTQMQAMYLAVGIVLIPAIILSGLMFSRQGMPWVTYWFGEMLPITHFLTIIRGIMVKGVGFNFLWPSVRALIILSVLYFAASVATFKKRL
jgi:ABC-2 type transport system permease protein